MSLDDALDDSNPNSIPMLCDECAAKGCVGGGFLALVRPCEKCKQDCCDHCFEAEDGKLCCRCAEGKPPPNPSIARELDVIYSYADEMMLSGRFDELDTALSEIVARNNETDILLGWLTATLPAKSKLPSRSRLFEQTEIVIRERGEWEDGLLDGLEP